MRLAKNSVAISPRRRIISSVGTERPNVFFVKLDREPVANSEHVAVVFAAISDAVFGEQCCVDLVPRRFGIGEHAVQIEDHSAEGFRHDVALRCHNPAR